MSVEQLPRRAVVFFDGLSPVRKAMLAGVVGVTAAVIVLLYSWSSSTEYVTLYSRLDAADSGAVVEQLREQGVPYEIEQGGSTILVPANRADEVRLDLASQGLPESGQVGFEIFDGNAFTATDFVQRLNFQRGLQGELERTIESFPAVEHARVHIVLPARTLFIAEEEPATASVVLQLRQGRSLTAEQVSGIAHLVSGAVEGLSKENLTIVDGTGNVLFDGRQLDEFTGSAISANQITMQQEYEKGIERDIQAMLDRTLGAGRSAVQVRASLNFDRMETESESFEPGGVEDQGVPRSDSTVTETYTTSGEATTGAIPGALTNIPGADQAVEPVDLGESSTTDYQRTESTTNYEVARTVTRSVQAPGRVDRLSLSLLLDEAVPAAQAESLADAVAAAAGIDEERGDRVVVSQLPFDRSTAEAAAEAFAADAATDQIFTYARMALPVIVLIVAFFIFRYMTKSLDRRSGYVVYEDEEDEEYEALEGPRTAGALPSAPRLQALPEAPTPAAQRTEVEKQVTKLAEGHPESVAEVIQAWMRQ